MIAANLAAPYHTAVAVGQGQCSPSRLDDGIKGKIVIIGDWATERPTRIISPISSPRGA